MKKINLLIITTLSIFLYNCSETKEMFAIATKDLKQVYKPTETVNLSIENVENAKIDSVIYFSNDIKLGKSTENAVFNLKLDKLQFGIQDIKAIVHSEGEKIECVTSFELVSNITPKLYETKDYTILNTYNHDANAYTQGLEFYNGILHEGTGQNGESSLRKTDYKGWSKGLKKAGYATDKNYPKKLIKIIETYELYEFDKIREKDLKRVKKGTSKTQRKPKVKTKKRPKKYYQVKKGDTLYSIARKHETTVANLKKVNTLTSNTLSIGQKLRIN